MFWGNMLICACKNLLDSIQLWTRKRMRSVVMLPKLAKNQKVGEHDSKTLATEGFKAASEMQEWFNVFMNYPELGQVSR